MAKLIQQSNEFIRAARGRRERPSRLGARARPASPSALVSLVPSPDLRMPNGIGKSEMPAAARRALKMNLRCDVHDHVDRKYKKLCVVTSGPRSMAALGERPGTRAPLTWRFSLWCASATGPASCVLRHLLRQPKEPITDQSRWSLVSRDAAALSISNTPIYSPTGPTELQLSKVE